MRYLPWMVVAMIRSVKQLCYRVSSVSYVVHRCLPIRQPHNTTDSRGSRRNPLRLRGEVRVTGIRRTNECPETTREVWLRKYSRVRVSSRERGRQDVGQSRLSGTAVALNYATASV